MAKPDEVDKGTFKIVKQPMGGGDIRLYGENMDEANMFAEAARISEENCGKHRLGGGFNTNGVNPDEIKFKKKYKGERKT
ncbi:hypothetical protein A2Z22_00565 [Candidatus Woesebacteria bacterium RBG_16_34_12]|uniref:Uncharacterized protein n=1 Tax=Candidatus Woesebacteria bacterium RBG_16_34_12 TaxID=1802480 RepID=A0A1F7X931_9BACT|nr:MAG: hypothetical protein A2Z22_00565 [Candidatus Woesebacteria bacterium RBG_16_34_12]